MVLGQLLPLQSKKRASLPEVEALPICAEKEGNNPLGANQQLSTAKLRSSRQAMLAQC